MIDVHRLFERWGLDGVREAVEKSGRELYACCPFHGESTPSFSVNLESGQWHCFTCHERGTKVEYLIAKMEGFDRDVQVDLFLREYGTPTVDERSGRLMRELQAWRHKRWPDLVGPDRNTCELYLPWQRFFTPYMTTRGFDEPHVRAHHIGYNAQRQEIVIPVFEHGTCRFTFTRTTTDRRRAKYLYPTDVVRTNYFWGLDQPPEHYEDSQIVLVEGSLDALWLKQHGIDNAIAILGSRISDSHIEKLQALSPAEVVLFFDNDDAGYDATDDAGKRLQQAGFGRVCYLRYLSGQDGFDPQKESPAQLERMMHRRRHIREFYLADQFGRNRTVRRVRARANQPK